MSAPEFDVERVRLMNGILIPTARRGGTLGVLRRLWTAPTTFIGHTAARLLGCRKPQRAGGQATTAWLYRLPDGRFKNWRAIAIGHVIIVEPALFAKHGRWLLAHELSHTRQHDWLGPTYLPVHAMLLFFSMVMFCFRPVAKFSPWHAYNPLERALICVPIDLVVYPPTQGVLGERILHAFGLEATRSTAGCVLSCCTDMKVPDKSPPLVLECDHSSHGVVVPAIERIG